MAESIPLGLLRRNKEKMLCEWCMTAMGTGTRYEKNRGGKSSARKYYECKNKKCGCRVYVKESNFHESMNKISEKRGNR